MGSQMEGRRQRGSASTGTPSWASTSCRCGTPSSTAEPGRGGLTCTTTASRHDNGSHTLATPATNIEIRYENTDRVAGSRPAQRLRL